MGEDLIRYDLLAQNALRSVIRQVLLKVQENGLPGEHHFFITFYTQAPGVHISHRLQERYPEEITIVLQHQFWDLLVEDDQFSIKLSFDNVPEPLVVPYEAIKGFFDPSVQFGLQFDDQYEIDDTETPMMIDPANSETALANVPTTALIGTSLVDDGEAKETADVTELKLPEIEEDTSKPELADEQNTEEGKEKEDAPAGEVVQLDAFRKKS